MDLCGIIFGRAEVDESSRAPLFLDSWSRTGRLKENQKSSLLILPKEEIHLALPCPKSFYRLCKSNLGVET
jgi:hypothetical protein